MIPPDAAAQESGSRVYGPLKYPEAFSRPHHNATGLAWERMLA
jgi:hypothetical protein